MYINKKIMASKPKLKIGQKFKVGYNENDRVLYILKSIRERQTGSEKKKTVYIYDFETLEEWEHVDKDTGEITLKKYMPFSMDENWLINNELGRIVFKHIGIGDNEVVEQIETAKKELELPEPIEQKTKALTLF